MYRLCLCPHIPLIIYFTRTNFTSVTAGVFFSSSRSSANYGNSNHHRSSGFGSLGVSYTQISKDISVSKNVSGGSIQLEPHACGGGAAGRERSGQPEVLCVCVCVFCVTQSKHSPQAQSAFCFIAGSLIHYECPTTLTSVSKASRGCAHGTIET